MPHDLKVFV